MKTSFNLIAAGLFVVSIGQAQLALTPAGVSSGFHLASFVTGFPVSGGVGPFGIAVATDGNVIVQSFADSRNYVFRDSNGQTVSNALSSTPFTTGGAVGFTTAAGSVWASGGFSLIKLNNDGTINKSYTLTGLNPTFGLWTNPKDGHIIAAGVSTLYDIDVSGRSPTFRVIPASGLSSADGVTVSLDGGTVYVADSGKISGYSISTGALVAGPIPVPGGPDGTGIISSSNALNGDIVVNTNSGQVILIDPKTLTQTVIATGGTRGDFVATDTSGGQFGGSLFVTQTAEIFRLDCGAGCGIGASAQLALTPAGMAKGFHLNSFVKGFPTKSDNAGPLGIGMTGTGNVIVLSSGDMMNYVFADANNQTLGNKIGSPVPFDAAPAAYTNAAGSVWGSRGKSIANATLIKFNNDGTVNTPFTIPGLNVTNGMWTNPANGHIIATGNSNPTDAALYEIDVSGSVPVFRVITKLPNIGDGVTVTPDGSIVYVATQDMSGTTGNVSGYDSVTGALVAGPFSLSNPDGIAVIASNNALNGNLVVNINAGQLILIDPKTGLQTPIANGGSRGDFMAPDISHGQFAGSAFVTQSTEIFRLDCGVGCVIGTPQLTLTPAGIALGFHLNSFVKGFPSVYNQALGGEAGPFGIAVTSDGNVIVDSWVDARNYVFADKNGQSISDALGSKAFRSNTVAPAVGFTNAGGSIWASVCDMCASSGIPAGLLKLNNDGTFRQSYTGITGPTNLLSRGLWTNAGNGHIIAAAGSVLYDIDVSGNVPVPRLIPTPANSGLVAVDGVSVSPDGSIVYVADGGAISGYNISTGALVLPPVPVSGADGTAVISSGNALNGDIVVNTNFGQLILIDPKTSPPTKTPIASGGTRGDFVAPDVGTGPFTGSLFVTQSSEIFRLDCGPGCGVNPPPKTPLTLTGSCGVGTSGSIYVLQLIAAGGSGSYSFSFPVLPSWLIPSTNMASANAQGFFNLVLSGRPPAAGTYSIGVTSRDNAGSMPATFSCNAMINPAPVTVAPLQIAGCPTSPAVQGASYSYSLAATGGSPPYSWTVSGSLPPGLASSGSTITGIPAGPPGVSNFSISVSSADDQSDQKSCSITVTAPPLQVTSCPGDGMQGAPYGPFGLAATGGTPSNYVFTIVGNLPAGIMLTGNSLGGTPTASGTFNFGIQVASGTLTSPARACSVTIAPSTLVLNVSCPASASIQAGSSVSASFSAMGGQSPYSFSLSGQPDWLGIGNGTVSGVPPLDAAGTSVSFTVNVTDFAKVSKSKSCGPYLVSSAPPTIDGMCPPADQMAGTLLTIPLIARGQGPFTWTYDNGEPDLALTSGSGSTNSLTGTLSKQGPFTFSVGLSDGNNNKAAPLTCPINVGPQTVFPPLQINASPTCPTTPVDFGTRFSTTLTASGGNGTFTWSVSPNPPFSVSSTTGKSTAVTAMLSTVGATTFTATLTDGANTSPATYTCTLTVAAPPPIPATITSGPIGATLTDVPLTITFPSPVAADVTGVLTLTFTSKAFAPIDNPRVVFNTGTRTYQFTVPAGTTSLPLNAMVQVGLVAGTIQIQLTSLTMNGQSVLPSPAPAVSLNVPALAPVIKSVVIPPASLTATGFNVVITGYSTPRDISSLMLSFTAAQGATVEGSPITVTGISSLISMFYQLSTSDSIFMITVPVTFTGDKGAIASVTVMLTNSVGSTASMTQAIP